jgi:hypothetical protein
LLFLINIYPSKDYLSTIYNVIKHKKEEHYRSFRTTPSPPKPSQNLVNQPAKNELPSSLLSEMKPNNINQIQKSDSGSINYVKVQEKKNDLKLQDQVK